MALLGLLPATLRAGTLEADIGASPFYSGYDTIGTYPLLTTICSALTDEEVQSKSVTYYYTRRLILHYTGTATDTPPTSVKVSFSDVLVAGCTWDIPAAPPGTSPNESITASYSIGSSPAYLLQDSTGTISQSMARQGGNTITQSVSRGGSNIVYSTPLGSWTSVTSGTTVVYTQTIDSWWVSGTASASVSTPKSKTKTFSGASWNDRLYSFTAVAN